MFSASVTPTAAAPRELYAEDATLYEPQVTGRETISGAVDSLLASMPPHFVFIPAGHAVGRKGVGRFFWRAVTGTDVAHVEGGRIKSLHVFLDPVPR